AEDGIRDRNVTGVQTCALPILAGFKLSAFLRTQVETGVAKCCFGLLLDGLAAQVLSLTHDVTLFRTHVHPTLGVAPEILSSLWRDRKSTRLNSSHVSISYAVFC